MIPQSMRTISSRLIQDIDVIAGTPEGIVRFCVRDLSEAERSSARIFIESLLDGTHSISQIQKVWWTLPSDLVFDNGDELVAFLSLLRDGLR